MFPQRGKLVEVFSISYTHSNSMIETRASASIEHAFTCPKKPPSIILFSTTSTVKKTKKADKSVAAAPMAPTRAYKPQ